MIVRLERRLVSVFPSLGTDGAAAGAAGAEEAAGAGAESEAGTVFDIAGMGAIPVPFFTIRIVSAGTVDSLLD